MAIEGARAPALGDEDKCSCGGAKGVDGRACRERLLSDFCACVSATACCRDASCQQSTNGIATEGRGRIVWRANVILPT